MSADHRFEQIADELRQQILDGTYPPGEPLPHTRVLLDRWGVSATTLTRALKILKEEQLIWRVGNRGMIVQKRQPVTVDITPSDLAALDRRTWEAICRRTKIDGRLLTGVREEPAEPDVARILHIPVGETVLKRAAVGSFAHQPVYMQEKYYPLAFSQSPPTTIVRQLVSARPADDDEAAMLKVARGSWALTVEQVNCDESGRLVELMRFIANPLRVRLLEEDLPLKAPS
ncbi:GntR family transcriptional regulator [Streptosporangium sp. NPDC001681]|uniref:GntR family transcriptional regulator n=1 Tax=Streptosporangium sp. NPDC001681 TaxID=3154395 RepID=UPI00332A56D2